MAGLLVAFALLLQAGAPDSFATLRDQWARNLRDKRVDVSAGEYAEDADFIDPLGHRVHGRAAIRALFQTITATFDSDLVFTSERVETSGDLAYDSGTFRETLTARATGKSQISSGSYLTVYRRDKDGGSLIVEQMWSGPPVETDAK